MLRKNAGVQHLIYSSLADVHRIAKGKYHVPHFTDKALVEQYVQDLQKQSPPAFKYTTFFGAGFYYQNFVMFFPPKKEGDDIVFSIPETSSISMYDVDDSGPILAAILNDPDQNNGKFIAACAQHASPQEILEIMQKHSNFGSKLKMNLVPRDTFAKFPFPGADELAQMFGWFNEYTYFGPEVDINAGAKLYPNMRKFADWVSSSYKFPDL